MMKTGLVLEGGAMRGMFTTGVIDVLMENEIWFDGAIGVSAGATFGCNYKSKQIGRPLRYCKRFAKDPRFCSFTSLFLTGDIFGVKFCYEDIPDRLDPIDHNTYEENPMPFYVVATECVTGKPVYVNLKSCRGESIKWMQASASMPMVSKTVKIGDKEYLDGGISDSIPLRFMEDEGYTKNVVVRTQPVDYVKKPAAGMGFAKVSLRKYPGMIRALERRHRMYNKEVAYINEAEKNGSAFVIAPPEELPVGRIEHDPEKLQAAYDIGRKVMTEKLEALKAFLNRA